jgi:hypothetical protein
MFAGLCQNYSWSRGVSLRLIEELLLVMVVLIVDFGISNGGENGLETCAKVVVLTARLSASGLTGEEGQGRDNGKL